MALNELLKLNGTGRPRAEVVIQDASRLKTEGLSGRICVQGVTLMGAPYTVVPIDSWDDFVKIFGGLHPSSDFPLYCRRALDNGGKLYVSRVAHWTGTAWEGTKASATITQAPNSITFNAREVGAGYNGVIITIRAAKSGDTTKVDIIERLGAVETIVYDITKTSPTVADTIKLNNNLRYTIVNIFPTTVPIGTATLANGAQTFASIVDADYVGSPTTETKGWFVFDEIYDSMRIFNLDRPVPAVDIALASYCEGRRDMRFAIRPTVSDCTGFQTMLDYRNGTGAYSQTAIDSMYGDLIAGNIAITDLSTLGGVRNISAIGDICGLMSKKDRTIGEAFSTAGPKRGVLSNVLDVPYNLDKPNLKDAFDLVYNNQINAVIRTVLSDGQSQKMQTAFWGNRTLQKDQATLLRYSNVADLAIYIRRNILPIIKGEVFEPNSPKYWYVIYSKVRVFIEKCVSLGYILGGENQNWFWRGDQNAKDLDSLAVNTKSDINLGIYKAQFIFVPTTLMEYIGVEARITDSETIVSFI